MKKNIYGIIDSRTHNFGDICLLDRDEEFRDGCMNLFSNPDIPTYLLSDLEGYRYGSVTFDSDMLFPKFEISTPPVCVVYGADAVLLRKDDVRRETVSENT